MDFNSLDVCNLNSTNKFETLVGVLNVAPTKISGQYKIVVDKNQKLWLDDYCGRRVAIDLSISFLEQVANFLQVNTILTDTNKLRYGGFQESTQKLWHIPMYFGSEINQDFPRFFVLNRVPNENLNHIVEVNIDYVKDGQVYAKGKATASNEIGQEHYEMGFPFRLSENIKVIDLKKIGLYDIFDEINKEEYFAYPIYFDWDEQKVNIFGYGINEGYSKSITINLTNVVSNQAYFDNVNNKILNAFVENGIFYPRFLNIEFEFDYDYDEYLFNNFMGYFAKYVPFPEGEYPIESNSETPNIVNWNGLNPQYNYIKVKDIDDLNDWYKSLSWQHSVDEEKYTLDEYLVQTAIGTIGEVSERLPNFRFQTLTVNVDDVIRIYHPEDLRQEFEYCILKSDIKDTVYDTWKILCQKLTKLSKREYQFTCKQYGVSTIITIEADSDAEECIIEIPAQYKVLNRVGGLQNYNNFRGITDCDVWLVGQPNLTTIGDTIVIDNNTYNIVDKFYITDEQQKTYSIIRLDRPSHIDKITICRMFETHKEYVCRLDPVNYLRFYSQIPSTTQSNIKEYSKELFLKFRKFKNKYTGNIETNEVFLSALSKFTGIPLESINKVVDLADGNKEINTLFDSITAMDNNLNQYVMEDTNKKLIDTEKIDINYVNETIVKSMIFCSMGNTAYCTPNIFNFSKEFWNKNGNLDQEQGWSDNLRFSWFLINGTAPKYCSDSWRYMTRTVVTNDEGIEEIVARPKITSRLIKITDSLCETIFLGVKYQLPIQYENYDFAVYLNYDNQKNLSNEYLIELYPEENLILLSINRYIDFNDLIRGADETNEALIDLSMFHNAHYSMNTSSNLYNNFSSIKLSFEPFYNDKNSTVTFNNIIQKDWIINAGDLNKPDYNICIKAKGDEMDLRQIFDTSEVNYKTFYKYCEIEYEGEKYVYPSMEVTFEGISNVFINYFWCKDIKVRFFDNRNIFLRRVDIEGNLGKDYYIPEYMEKILYVNKIKNILRYESLGLDSENYLYNDYHKKAVVVVNNNGYNYEERYELLLPDKVLSFKEDWFRFEKYISPDDIDGKKQNAVIACELLNGENYRNYRYYREIEQQLLDDVSNYDGSINLFERNQIWKLIKDMIENDIKFKEMTENQVKDYLGDFTLKNLMNLPNKNIIIINRNDEYYEYVDKYIPIYVIPINKNYVVWKINNTPKIYYINRFQAPYIPYLPIETDYFKFQIKEFQKYDTLWNLYDDKFGGIMSTGTNISATTLYQEVVGNIISTLFCKSDDIVLVTDYKQEINYRTLLMQIIDYNKCIINNDNTEYIASLNKNQREYIIETFTDFLLKKFYKLSEVKNELDYRLKYTVDKKNNYILRFPDKITLGSRYYNFDNIIIILRRI